MLGERRSEAGRANRLSVAIDGSYDGDLSFGLLQLDRDCKLLDQRRFRWSNIGREDDIRYVTGFDIGANGDS